MRQSVGCPRRSSIRRELAHLHQPHFGRGLCHRRPHRHIRSIQRPGQLHQSLEPAGEAPRCFRPSLQVSPEIVCHSKCSGVLARKQPNMTLPLLLALAQDFCLMQGAPSAVLQQRVGLIEACANPIIFMCASLQDSSTKAVIETPPSETWQIKFQPQSDALIIAAAGGSSSKVVLWDVVDTQPRGHLGIPSVSSGPSHPSRHDLCTFSKLPLQTT